MHRVSILRRTKYHACVHVRGLSPPSVPLFRPPSLRGAAVLSATPKEGRSERERASRLPCRRREDWRPRARRTEFRECESVGRHASGAEKARERKERRGEESRGKGCRHLHSNEARRECDGNHGSRGFLSRADLSVPLSGLSSSSFSSSGPLPSAHGAGISGRADAAPLSSRSVKKRWGGLGLAPRSGERVFFLFLPFYLRFAQPLVNSFFRVQEHRVNFDSCGEFSIAARVMRNFV